MAQRVHTTTTTTWQEGGPEVRDSHSGKRLVVEKTAAAPPRVVLSGQSACVNGVWLWMAEGKEEAVHVQASRFVTHDTKAYSQFLVVAFDLDRETFRLLPRPVGGLTRDHRVVQVPGGKKLVVAFTRECLFGGELGIWTFAAEHGLGAWVKP